MIEKITNIKNMATFQDFEWDKTVLNANKQPEIFKEINILYGRNYAGKTTLSRIVRAMETGSISSKYHNPEFIIAIKNGTRITQTNLSAHTQTIRVFNDDFVRENLRFIYNPNDDINSFAIGSKNTAVETQIAEKEAELGDPLRNTGVHGDLSFKKAAYDAANKAFSDAEQSLENKLSNKATGMDGIKNSPLGYDINYNIAKIKKDIEVVTGSSYLALTDTEKDNLTATVKQEQKAEISPSAELTLQLDSLATKAKTSVEQKITISNPIQDLLNDQLLEKWAKDGIALHKDKRTTCGFCGNPIGSDLWDKLSNHFNQESESLTTNIDALLTDIQTELDNSKNLFDINPNAFYSEFTASAQALKSRLDTEIKSYQSSLTSLSKQLKARLASISTPLAFSPHRNNSTELTAIQSEYEELRKQSNAYTTSLDENKKDAKRKLLLQEIYQFTQDIGYTAEKNKISQLEADKDSQFAAYQIVEKQVIDLKSEIKSLRDQLSDERLAATQINTYLNHFFGHAFLTIEPVKQHDESYRFEVWRNKQKAYQLSEGECSLIAFCYFMAKLEDVETKNSKPIIWIDDPISSLDSNHIFFIYSLISSKIIKSEKFQQLFVSTHNLDFLKYLKRLHDKKSDNKTSWQRNYFLIDRVGDSSQIRLMPQYLKKYATEFNYLFEQIYLCATAKIEDTEIKHDCFYNYGNNARKFLNAYLFYHHPNPKMGDDEKLKKFLDDDIAYELLDRLHNEHSHLEEFPDRSMKPIDIPEMKKSAKLILVKINEKNSNQFSGLCESIGILSLDAIKLLA